MSAVFQPTCPLIDIGFCNIRVELNDGTDRGGDPMASVIE